MISYLVQRLLQGVLVLFLVSLLTFFVMYFMPGDPARNLVGQGHVTEEQLQTIRDKWGLDDPWYQRYWEWISNVVHLDFGTSMMRPGMPIGTMIRQAASMTIRLNVLSFLISMCVAVPVGIFAAIRRYSWFDYTSMLGST